VTRRPDRNDVLLTAGILAASFNMRAAVTSLPPVYPELARAGVSPAAEAVLAAVPVLSFAVFSGVAAGLARRLGEERLIGIALGGLTAGLGLRALAPGAMLFPGTVIASCSIALMNVLLPSLVKRRRPDRVGLLIGMYLTSLTVGAVVGAAIAVPVFNAAGGAGAAPLTSAAVRLTLGMWAIPAAIAAVCWLPQLKYRTRPAAAGDTGSRKAAADDGQPAARQPTARRPGVLAMSRHALAWQVASFMGMQSLSYYATLSWFPSLLRDHGLGAAAAGDLLALMNIGNAITGLIVPVLAQRARDQRALAAVSVCVIIAGLAGIGFGPVGAAPAFVLLLGFGQGGAFSLAVYLFTARSADGPTVAALSGFAQGTGYLVAAAGPLLIGFLHAATGAWAASVWVLIGVGGVQLAAGVLAGRPLTIGPGELVSRPARPADSGRSVPR
jgi:MFS transporter, CP family, cyanate transporter